MIRCEGCGSTVPPDTLACPSCRALLHREELKRLAADAERMEATGDLAGALSAWRQAQALLPPETRQSQVVQARAAALSQKIAASAPSARPDWAKRLGPFGVVLLVILSKGKFLLLGLTKASTFLSMILSLGAYWTMFGWRFALGLVASIYVHEMGHVSAMRSFGLPATAPMFIPGVGAVVRLKRQPTTPVEDARIGLAGPLWGVGATVAALAVAQVLGSPTWRAIAHASAWINLFNLLPVWQLDGSRGFAALARGGRLLAAAVFAAIWHATDDGFCLLLALVAGARAFGREAPTASDRTTLVEFLLIAGALGLLFRLSAA